MNKKISFLLIFCIASLLISCATTPRNIDVTVTDPDRIRFQGKGAGAGMMLMSSMGAMGIAIGVAIDEGIGKDIDTTARAAELNIQDIVVTAAKASELPVTGLTVERYGFVTRSGDDDPVAAQLHITVLQKDGTKRLVKYPEDFEAGIVIIYPLEEVKRNGTLSTEAFKYAAKLALAVSAD
ncbi:MAG: hypothetical protein K6L81_17370 [Agarilytica sp.]